MAQRSSDPFGITVAAAPVVANFIIPKGPGDYVFDGAAEGVQPGDVVQFESGTHGTRRLQNLHGTAQNPILVRNDPASASPAVIRRETGSSGSFVLWFRNCRHVIVDGGARPGLSHGIKVMYAASGADGPSSWVHIGDNSTGEAAGTPTSFMTFRKLEVDGGWQTHGATNGVGIALNEHTNFRWADHPSAWHQGFVFDGLYLHEIEGEGMYIGPNWVDGDLPCKDVEIKGCRIENTGWDSIQVKAFVAGTNSIHHCVCKNSGLNEGATGSGNQFYGISLAHSTGDIHDNWMENAGSQAIQHYVYQLPESTGLGPFHSEIYNNVSIKTRGILTYPGWGITVGSDATSVQTTTRVYNNTLVDNPNGIQLNSRVLPGSVVANNILADSGSVSVPSGSTASNNRVGSIAAMSFENAAADDFHLTSSSPARNAATGTAIASTDYDGVARPKGAAADQGAFEFVE